MGLAEEVFDMGRSKHAGVWDLFHGGGTGGYYLWFGNSCDDPPHKTGPGRVT